MISVASYNIQKSIGTDFRRRPARILDVLGELNADVIALQEVDRRFGQRVSSLDAREIVEHTQYQPIRFGIRPDSLGWHGNVLLVRKDIEVLNSRMITLPAFEPRGAVLADLRIDNITLRVVGMHLGLLGRWRKRQAQAVIDQLEQLEHRLPTVMMGDLNEWNIERGCLAHFARSHNVGAPGPSFPSVRPTFEFDRIITSKDLSVSEIGVHQTSRSRQASDHLPVWARLAVNAAIGELHPTALNAAS